MTSANRSEYSSLLKLGFPILVTQAGIILVNFADTIMVASYSTEALAASAFINSLYVIVTVMMIGFAAGMIPLVGALFGQSDKKGVGEMFRAGMEVNVLVSVAFSIIMTGIYFILHLFNQPPEIIPISRPYFLTLLASLIPLSIFNTCQQSANALNDTKTPMWIILGSNVLNVAGNYTLIFGHFGMPEMGLTGAGLSTLGSRVAATIAIIVVMMRKSSYTTYLPYFRKAPKEERLHRRVWTISYPVMLQNGIECGFWAFGAIVCGWFGKIPLASYQIANTVAQLGFMTFLSYGIAVSVRVSHHFGVNDLKAVRRTTNTGLCIVLLMAALASAIFVVGGKNLLHLFTPDMDVVMAASLLIVPLVLYQFADATQLTYVNALRGMGDVQPLIWVSVISYIVVGVPLMLWLGVGLNLGNIGVYYSFSGVLFTAALLLYLSYRRALRKYSR